MTGDEDEAAGPRAVLRARTAGLLASADEALRGAGVPALLLLDVERFPTVELLVPRRLGRRAWSALDRLPYRWRFGGEGSRRLVARRTWAFDGGLRLTAHRQLPAGPLPPVASARVGRELWRRAGETGPGVTALDEVGRALHALAQLRLHGRRDRTELAYVRELVTSLPAGSDLEASVGRAGLGEPLAWVTSGGARPGVAGGVRAAGRRVLARVPDRVRPVLAGDPWTGAVARVRFAGIELLAGPGTFLPRGESEPMVGLVVAAVEGVSRPALVEVGTGCGAVALAVACRRPDARVLAVELDGDALRWADRNRRRLDLDEVDLRPGSLLDPVVGDPAWSGVDVVLGNVPFVLPEDFGGEADAPDEAYVGSGADGLDLHRTMARQATTLLRPGGTLVLQLTGAKWSGFVAELAGLGYREPRSTPSRSAVIGAVTWPG